MNGYRFHLTRQGIAPVKHTLLPALSTLAASRFDTKSLVLDSMARGKSDLSVRATSEVDSTSPETAWDRFLKVQKTQARLPFADLARTVVQNHTTGILSVISSRKSTRGFPKTSTVPYAAGADGKPIFCLSELAPHSRDLRSDGKAGFMIHTNNTISMRSQRVILTGLVKFIESDVEKLKEEYLEKLPNAVYVNFGDFYWYKMEEILQVQYTVDTQSTARFSTFSGDSYLDANPDPVSGFLSRIKNETADAKPIVKSKSGLEVDTAELARLDALGVEFSCTMSGYFPFTCRVTFSKRGENLEEVRERLEELRKEVEN